MARELEITATAERDEEFLRGLDTAELQREGIERMLNAEERGVFPLRDDSYLRIVRETWAREEVEQ